MFKSNAQVFNIFVLSSVLTLFCTNSFAEVYKWRNTRGVVQYSDKPPLASFTKATRNEIVNALQSKDVCVLPANNANANNTLANFFGRGTIRGNNTRNSLSSKTRPILLAANRPITNALASPKSSALAGNVLVTSKSSSTLNANSAVASNQAAVALPKTAAAATAPKQTLAQAAPIIAKIAPITPTIPSSSPTSNIIQVALMPAVDISKNMVPAIGESLLRIQPTTELPLFNNDGAFRISCPPSHMSNDDPIVYPNQPGAAHHHTFFGNTSINAKSDLMHLDTAGNSTCTGGGMNHAAYWVPSMIDTATNKPVKPSGAIFYYKSWDVPSAFVTAPPKGLRMITGNSKSTSADTSSGMYSCVNPTLGGTPWTKTIPNCAVGTHLLLQISFPQCWDGINLDSPDHKSHMANASPAYTTANKCPASHPIAIPLIAQNINFDVTTVDQTKNWRLASDNYSSTIAGGYSAHADWVNGWDTTTMSGWVKNCLNKGMDCHASLLGDGRVYF